jgi:hypothetical protein
MLNAPIFYPINWFNKYKMIPDFKKLKHEQFQQLIRFMKEHNLYFPKHALCLFSMAQFVRNCLLSQMKPSSKNNKNKLARLPNEFLKQCSMKFGLYLSPQFIVRGRSNSINPRDIIQFQSTTSFEKQLLALSNYGTATLLGNTSAIAEISYRLCKIEIYDRRGNIDNNFKLKLLRLIEYGISRRCPDCLGVMAYLYDVGLGIIPVDRQHALELAGRSAEAGSIYGWFSLARLLKGNSDKASYHDRYDGIDVDESDLGVRLFVRSRIPLDEQIRKTFEEYGCEGCPPQFYDGKERCRNCEFEFDVFNHNSDDDDTSVPKSEQMRIAVEIFYKILSENPSSHPICVDVRKILLKIYKARERLFGGSIEATDEEILRMSLI